MGAALNKFKGSRFRKHKNVLPAHHQVLKLLFKNFYLYEMENLNVFFLGGGINEILGIKSLFELSVTKNMSLEH